MNAACPAATQAIASLGMPGRHGVAGRVGDRTEARLALAPCGAVLVSALVQRLEPGRPAYAAVFAPDWIASRPPS
jgi:hypothetical protein